MTTVNQDVLASCQANTILLDAVKTNLNLKGFVKGKPSRKDLEQQLDLVLIELSDVERLIRIDAKTSGGIG